MDEQRLLLREATSPWFIGPRKPIRKLVLVESIAARSGPLSGGRSTQLNDPGEKRQMSVELIGLDPQPVGSLQDIMKGQTEPGGLLGQCIGRQVGKLEDQKPGRHLAGRNRLKRFGVEPAPGDKIIGTGGAGVEAHPHIRRDRNRYSAMSAVVQIEYELPAIHGALHVTHVRD